MHAQVFCICYLLNVSVPNTIVTQVPTAAITVPVFFLLNKLMCLIYTY